MNENLQKISNYFTELIKKYENLGYKVKKKILFIIGRIFLYYVLIELAFLFVLPFIYIFTKALMTSADYMDATINWIPTAVNWKNFSEAWKALDYTVGFRQTIITSLGSAILQTVFCALAGYSLGRYKGKWKSVIFILVVLVLLIPPQTTILSAYGIFVKMGMINTFLPILLPCLFGLGIRGALFILIYMYFFQRVPDAMDDAARIDGAGAIRVFSQIMLPLVKSATVITFMFSFVWHWNDNFEASTYMYRKSVQTLQPRLQNIRSYYSDIMMKSTGADSLAQKALTEPMLFAGCLIVMLPVLIVYIFGQKRLAAGIERIGVIE